MLGTENGLKGRLLMNGKILGTSKNTECRIDSIAQSWSVISLAGDRDKTDMALESLEKFLVNRDVRYY